MKTRTNNVLCGLETKNIRMYCFKMYNLFGGVEMCVVMIVFT